MNSKCFLFFWLVFGITFHSGISTSHTNTGTQDGCTTIDTSSNGNNCIHYGIRVRNGICQRHFQNSKVYTTKLGYLAKEKRLYSMMNPLKVALDQFSALPDNNQGFQQFSRIIDLMAMMRGVAVPQHQYPLLWAVARKEGHTCYKTIEALYCHQFYPICQSINNRTKLYPVCQSTCIELKKLNCAGFLNMMNILNLGHLFAVPQCSSLPEATPAAQIPCVMPNVAKGTNLTSTTKSSIYCDLKTTTESGYQCQQWNRQCPHQHSFTDKQYNELHNARNTCRNPGGVYKRPWCFTTNQTIRWEYCTCKDTTVTQSVGLLPTETINVTHTSAISSLVLNTTPILISTVVIEQQPSTSKYQDTYLTLSIASPVITSMHLTVVPTEIIPSQVKLTRYSISYSASLVNQIPEQSTSQQQLVSTVTPSSSIQIMTTTITPMPSETVTMPSQHMTKPTDTPRTVYPSHIQPWVDYNCPVYNTTMGDSAMCGNLIGSQRVRGRKAYLDNKQKSLHLFYSVMMPIIRSFLENGKAFDINSVVKAYLGKSSPNITKQFKDLKIPTVASFNHCAEIGLIYSCHYFNPFCKIRITDDYYYQASPLHICREACHSSQMICNKELTFLRAFNEVKRNNPDMMTLNPYYVEIPDCSLLPWKQPGRLQQCFIPQRLQEITKNQSVTDTCYKDSGLMYRGNVNKTETSKGCLTWDHLEMKQWQENTPGEFNYLRNSKNYCRNIQGMGTRPWCLVKDENNTIIWEYCKVNHCPVNGQFSEWSSFSNCSSECGRAIKVRTRQCNNPIPQFGGNNCTGPTVNELPCQSKPCPVNGGYSEWIYMAICNATCSVKGIQLKYRICNNPSPQHGGSNCSHLGASTISVPCIMEDCREIVLDVYEKEKQRKDGKDVLIVASGAGVAILIVMVAIVSMVICKQKHMAFWETKEKSEKIFHGEEHRDSCYIEPYNEIHLTPDNIATIIKGTNNDENVAHDKKPSIPPSTSKQITTTITKNGTVKTIITDD